VVGELWSETISRTHRDAVKSNRRQCASKEGRESGRTKYREKQRGYHKRTEKEINGDKEREREKERKRGIETIGWMKKT